MQVDAWERGFSYSYDAPLDMRMDPDQDLDAREIVNDWDERRLAQLFQRYGEEPFARRIAREIVRRRDARPDRDHDELVEADQGRRARRRAPQLRRRPSGQARLPGDPHRRERRARLARPRAARRLGPAAPGRPPRPRSPSTRSRTGASSASSPTARAAASARPTSRSAAAGASPRPSCSPGARSRRPPARSPTTRARRPGDLRAARKIDRRPA